MKTLLNVFFCLLYGNDIKIVQFIANTHFRNFAFVIACIILCFAQIINNILFILKWNTEKRKTVHLMYCRNDIQKTWLSSILWDF